MSVKRGMIAGAAWILDRLWLLRSQASTRADPLRFAVVKVSEKVAWLVKARSKRWGLRGRVE